jgi:hypothetical protein
MQNDAGRDATRERKIYSCDTHGGAITHAPMEGEDCPLRANYGKLTGDTAARAIPCVWRDANTNASARRYTYDYTNDALRDLGRVGILDIGVRAIAYAFCERENAFHLSDTRANTRIPTRGRVRLQWRFNTSQRGACKDVRTGTLADSRNARVRALA